MRFGRFVRPIPLAIILLANLIGAAGSALAQNENETVGFQTNHIFESGAFGENIDILNGGLNLSIPIGPKYLVSPYLSYQLQLSYGSKIWDHTPYAGEDDTPHGRSNMGLGFNLHFGRIFKDVEATEDIVSALGAAGMKYAWFGHIGEDYRSMGDSEEGRSTHFIITYNRGDLAAGDFHTGEWALDRHPWKHTGQAIVNAFESIGE